MGQENEASSGRHRCGAKSSLGLGATMGDFLKRGLLSQVLSREWGFRRGRQAFHGVEELEQRLRSVKGQD